MPFNGPSREATETSIIGGCLSKETSRPRRGNAELPIIDRSSSDACLRLALGSSFSLVFVPPNNHHNHNLALSCLKDFLIVPVARPLNHHEPSGLHCWSLYSEAALPLSRARPKRPTPPWLVCASFISCLTAFDGVSSYEPIQNPLPRLGCILHWLSLGHPPLTRKVPSLRSPFQCRCLTSSTLNRNTEVYQSLSVVTPSPRWHGRNRNVLYTRAPAGPSRSLAVERSLTLHRSPISAIARLRRDSCSFALYASRSGRHQSLDREFFRARFALTCIIASRAIH